jgi:hypothetical protein
MVIAAQLLGKKGEGTKIDELTRRDHFGFLPVLWKMPQIARHQIVCARSIGAF